MMVRFRYDLRLAVAYNAGVKPVAAIVRADGTIVYTNIPYGPLAGR